MFHIKLLSLIQLTSIFVQIKVLATYVGIERKNAQIQKLYFPSTYVSNRSRFIIRTSHWTTFPNATVWAGST